MSISIKEAVANALQEINELFSHQIISGVLLEEVDRNNREDFLITIGFNRPSTNRTVSAVIAGFGAGVLTERIYKVVCVNKESGSVESIKDRVLEKK
jgi:hypothetical protein